MVLVDVTAPGRSSRTLRSYVILDDQSTNSFATSSLLDFFALPHKKETYSITTISGSKIKSYGRTTEGFRVKGVNRSESYALPPLFEHNGIPHNKYDVATREDVLKNPDIAHLASEFLPLDCNAPVSLLLGRDAEEVLVADLIHRKPPVYKTPLGWTVVGRINPSEPHPSNMQMSVYKTQVEDHFSAQPCFGPLAPVFDTRMDDESPGLSVEDRKFLSLIDENIVVNAEGHLETPLPFIDRMSKLPDNTKAVYRRSRNTLVRLVKDPAKLQQCLKIVQDYVDSGHVEVVPSQELQPAEGHFWYLPVFPVTHPKKKKVRIVFDSAAQYFGRNLNGTLLQGPDANNSLRGVLLRFRENKVGFVADVEKMFHAFYVRPSDRNFLRFFWFQDNDPCKALVSYRARVHVFGNRSSPAVATHCLRHAIREASREERENGDRLAWKALSYVERGFYVDDGLGSAGSAQEAVDILVKTREYLETFKVRLHKISSSHQEVLNAFPESEREEGKVEFWEDGCSQRTLGVTWNTTTDRFDVHTEVVDRPFTKRGLLATVNSIFDPIGLASPVVLGGRLIMRTLIPPVKRDPENLARLGWDDPLPVAHLATWESWKESLRELSDLSLDRCLIPGDFGEVHSRSLHSFADASEQAIGHVSYLRSVDVSGRVHVAFVSADSKVAPRAATSIPRLELCAAVECSEASRRICEEISVEINDVVMYSDSKVVLGYLNNETKRFSKYVTRRIEAATKVRPKELWRYVATECNPADMASRPTSAENLKRICWLTGPSFLWEDHLPDEQEGADISLSVSLPEEKLVQECSNFVTSLQTPELQREVPAYLTGDFVSIRRASRLATNFYFKWKDRTQQRKGVALAIRPLESLNFGGEKLAISDVQHATFQDVISNLKKEKDIPLRHPLSSLSPFIDADGLLRVGGRLRRVDLPGCIKHPIVLPEDHPLTSSIVSHYHKLSGHQGAHISHGAVRDAGYHIVHGKKVIRKFVNDCVVCRKLRRRPEEQKMSDLPEDRLACTAPFTNTGLDVAGPWQVVEGISTRSNKRTSKVWALVLTCLTSRAVHVEPLPAMDTSSFRNALRRFMCVRGSCKIIRSDRGSNFVGSYNQDLDMRSLTKTLQDFDVQWIFNPPHAPHFGGVWERKVGAIKKAMLFSLSQCGMRTPSRDELYTFFQEAASIVNNTPLWSLSSDPNDPQPLTPNMLLTLKEAGDNPPLCDTSPADLIAYGKKRWRRVNHLAEVFWQKWKSDYIQELQSRSKWTKRTTNLSPGDIVMLVEPSPRNKWAMGKVVRVKKSEDGLVRSVVVSRAATAGGTIACERPIGKVVSLGLRGDN